MTLFVYFTMRRMQWSFKVISTLDIPTLGFLSNLNSVENSLSWMFWWITQGLPVSLQYITYTGLLTNFLSFTSFKYKVGLIYTLVERRFKINNTTTGREKDLQQLSITLQRNSFASHLIDKIIKGYKNKFSLRPTQNDTSTTGVNTTGIRYFKLPFVGDFSTVTCKKLKHLLEAFCKDIEI